MPSISEIPLQTLVCTKASAVPSFVWTALFKDEIHSNVILPILNKCLQSERNGVDVHDHLWIICYTCNGNVQNLKLVASCTDSLMGKYPVFLYSPIPYLHLTKDPIVYHAVNAAALEVYKQVGSRRVYSVFGPDILSRTFVGIWQTNTTIGLEPGDPYYSSLISYCTPETFINRALSLPQGEHGDLRLATPADRDGVAKLCYTFAKDSPPFLLSKEQAYYEADELIRNRIVYVHTLESSRGPQGIVSLVAFTRNTQTTATITKVVTDPHARGRKCAERLTRYVCSQLFAAGRTKIALYVGVDNVAAKVYQRVGFVGIGDKPTPAEGVDPWVEYGFDRRYVDLGHW